MVAQFAVTFIFLILFTQIRDQTLSDVMVQDDHVIVNFPESIDFSVKLESGVSIEAVTLIYGTNATTCNLDGSRQPQAIDPGSVIEVEWQWDLRRSGAVPPGAEVWWQWEIEDGAGHVLLTERQTMRVVDDRHRWQELSEGNVTVYWYEGDDAFGRSLLAYAVDSLQWLSDEAGLATADPLQLWAYPTTADVRDAVVNAVEWMGGAAFPQYGITLIASRPNEDEWTAEVIAHEFAHLLEGSVVFNCRGGHMPTWLSEGLAELSSGESSEADLARLERRLAQESLPSLNLLSRGFSAYGGEADLAYTQSREVVRYLIEVYGPEKMRDLMDQIKSGMAIDEALEATYGFDTRELDANWRRSLGYAPASAAEDDGMLLMAEPTQVPTIAWGGIPAAATATVTPAAAIATAPTASPSPSPPPSPAAVTAAAVPTSTSTAVEAAAVRVTERAPVTADPIKTRPANFPLISAVLIMVGAGLVVLIGLVVFLNRFRGG